MKNKYKVIGDITEIYIMYRNKEYTCLITTERLPLVSKYSWKIIQTDHTMYVTNWKHERLHRHILNILDTPGVDGDHIDGNGLNNLDSNLRAINRSLNLANRNRKSIGTTSIYLNVTLDPRRGGWISKVKKDGVTHTLGTYDLEWVAALVSLKYKQSIYGEDYVPKDTEEYLLRYQQEHMEEYLQCIKDSETRKKYRGGTYSGTSGIKGVCWRSSRKKWMASIRVDGKIIHLGQYSNKYDAGRAVTRATLLYLGSSYVDRVPINLHGGVYHG